MIATFFRNTYLHYFGDNKPCSLQKRENKDNTKTRKQETETLAILVSKIAFQASANKPYQTIRFSLLSYPIIYKVFISTPKT